jgi:hypothetical protein
MPAPSLLPADAAHVLVARLGVALDGAERGALLRMLVRADIASSAAASSGSPQAVRAKVSGAVTVTWRSRARRAIAARRESIVCSGVFPTWLRRPWAIDRSVISTEVSGWPAASRTRSAAS